MLGKHVSHLVSFEDVLERPDLESEIIRHAHEHEDFILAVRMAMDYALALEDLENSIELKIATRRNFRFSTFEIFECALVIESRAEFIADYLLHSLACLWI